MAYAVLGSFSVRDSPAEILPITSAAAWAISGSKLKALENKTTPLGFMTGFKKYLLFKITDIHATFGIDLKRRNASLRLKALRDGPTLIREITSDEQKGLKETDNGFTEIKRRFLDFKTRKYMEDLDTFQKLAKAQAPKFMVISCADSRVCPSHILGFQPGEAFVIRNIANLVPPYEYGPCETSAALEFSVNTLEVENILVTGHSRCGGIRALMSLEDEVNTSSFVKRWVVVGKSAKLRTQNVASNLGFDQQCKHCEKESINGSLLNLLTYPWIEERVAKGLLSLHGGYYDFVDCTYEKWTIDYRGSCSNQENCGYCLRNREFWS